MFSVNITIPRIVLSLKFSESIKLKFQEYLKKELQ